jgi:hypothetical protein
MAYGYCVCCRRLYILKNEYGRCGDCGGLVEVLGDQEARWLLKGWKGGEVHPDGKRPKKRK